MPIYKWEAAATWSLFAMIACIVFVFTPQNNAQSLGRSLGEIPSYKTNLRTAPSAFEKLERDMRQFWTFVVVWICTLCLSLVIVIWTMNCMLHILMLHQKVCRKQEKKHLKNLLKFKTNNFTLLIKTSRLFTCLCWWLRA